MKKLFQNHQFGVIGVLLLLGNLLLLPITADEAYYFSWGKELAWGYFDHPPLVGWLTSLIPANLVRAPFFVLSSLLVLFASERHMKIALVVPGAHLFLGGALPDTLLVVTGFLVLWQFKRWRKHPTVLNGLLLGVTLLLLAYSKFHGILLVASLAIGFWSYRKQWTLYLAVIVAAVGLLPYLNWQSEHQWVTFAYHFSGRFHEQSLASLFEFLGMALLCWWPVFLFIKSLPLWSKTLIVLSLLLFGWGAFQGSAELHWLLVFLWVIPELDLSGGKRTKGLALGLTVVHACLWIPLVWQLAGLSSHFREDIEFIRAEDNVVFLDSYQDASIYEWRTGKSSYHLAHPGIRKSQYNLRPYPFEGEEVTVYNRLGMGSKLRGLDICKLTSRLHDLSYLEGKWDSEKQAFNEPISVPEGYNWILYTYDSNGVELSRENIGIGSKQPVIEKPQHNSFLTLEKNWLPSMLWIPLTP